MRIIFNISIVIKIVQKILMVNMSKIRISYEPVLILCRPKSGQPVYRYLIKIWTSHGPALVSINKHYKTLINNTNKAKLEKRKKQAYFFKLFLIFFKKSKISNRYKFYELKVFKTKKAVDQNWDKLVTTLSKKATTVSLNNLFFENYLLLFLIELFPDDFSWNCSCHFCMSSLTLHSTEIA